MKNSLWTREEEIIVFNLFCKIPFQKSSKNHPEVIRVANIIGRTPSSVNMKIGNFGSFDDNLKKEGIVGLTNASKLDAQIFAEFNGNWAKLAFESEKILASYEGKTIDTLPIDFADIPRGEEKDAVVKQRVNQHFFREAVLASYSNSCCITGINNSELLIASHIKPWKHSDENEKTNPQNGLCLNALHDKAFDRGFLTITPDMTIHISKSLSDVVEGRTIDLFFKAFDGKSIKMPEKFLPKKEFLQYHNDMIFENWKKHG